MRKIYLFTFLWLLWQGAFAQQYPLFTNYQLNKYGYNPAIHTDTVGVFANLVYRKQWVGIEGAPETMIAGVRSRLKPLPVGAGGYFFNDFAGIIRRTGGYGMLNMVRKLGKDTHLSAGVAVGFYSFRLDGEIRTEDEVDQLVPNALDGKMFADFNAGVYLEHKDFYAGFSVPQITEKQLSFTDQPDKSILQRHYYALLGYRYRLNDKVVIEPSALFKYIQNSPLQWDAGLKIAFDKFWLGGTYRKRDAMILMAGVNLGTMELAYGYDITTSSLRTVSNGTHELSLELRLGIPKDKDGDGCPDKEDKCPDKPGPKENDCCPEESPNELLADADGDGCPDKEDKCPNEAGPKSNDCCPFGDRDGDGIRDDVDKCPDLPGVASNQGCPIDDRDQDGIVDKFDKCPDEPGSLLNEGCPFQDSDGDGVADKNDKCPNTKGLPGNDGCPVATAAEMEILNLAIKNLYFDTDKSEIWQESYPFLNKLAELLLAQPDWKLKIAGHADHRASDEYNLALSKRRSEAVMFYLMNRGVKRNKLIVEYYGENMPVASNASQGGMQLNRRVEMTFVFH
jgi:type IX secretion system PorP/SprF family membrane protein